MTPCYQVEFQTPKRFTLNGLWFGTRRAKRVYIFVHGLAGSVFGEAEKRLTKALVSSGESVFIFNNRGHDIVSKLYGDAPRTKKGYKRIVAGAAHEVFTDCVDDIEGAVQFAEHEGARQIVLIGHSTGCQKSVYWASKRARFHRSLAGIVLLGPLSDRAVYLHEVGERKLESAIKKAKALVAAGKGTEILPRSVWDSTLDAQRLLSLAMKTSSEELFTYSDERQVPTALRSVRVPMLALLAEEDEYSDRPAAELYDWFLKHIYEGEVAIVPEVGHSYRGAEGALAKAIRQWLRK